MKPYEYGDELYSRTEKTVKQLFRRRRLLDFDEINALKVSKSVRILYKRIDEVVRKHLLLLLRQKYKERSGILSELYWEEEEDFIEMWLEKQLKAFDGVTKYVYAHELDRKRARLYESLMADKQLKDRHAVEQDYKNAERYVLRQIEQTFIDVEDAFVNQMQKDAGLEQVQWFTQEDERVCDDCGPMNGLVFPVDRVPPKPHWGCRCYLRAVTNRSGD